MRAARRVAGRGRSGTVFHPFLSKVIKERCTQVERGESPGYCDGERVLLCGARPPTGDDEHEHAVSAQRAADSELWRVAEPRRRENEKVEQAKQPEHMRRGHKNPFSRGPASKRECTADSVNYITYANKSQSTLEELLKISYNRLKVYINA